MTGGRNLREKLKEVWSLLTLGGRGAALTALPLVAVVFSASLAFVGNRQRALTESAVVHHIGLMESLGQLSMVMLNAETGLRGYLLARQAEFLQPYELAAQSRAADLDHLHSLVESEPGVQPREKKRARLMAIRATVEEAMTIFDGLRAQAVEKDTDTPAPSNEAITLQLVRSKAVMDKLRAQLLEMRSEEETLLSARLSDIERVRRRDYLTIAAALLLGLVTRGVAFYFFNHQVAARVQALTGNLKALRPQEPAPPPRSDTQA
jgi:CHASE3 domain sensor protein